MGSRDQSIKAHVGGVQLIPTGQRSRIHKGRPEEEPRVARTVKEKLAQILENPYGVGKWMHGEYSGVREVHLMGKRFVLMYTVDEDKKQVNLVKFGHHPKKY